MKRREFITLVSGAVAWPLVSHAQQTDRLRRIVLLMTISEKEPEAQARRIPSVYKFSYFTIDGGLLSYGPDTLDFFRRSAFYVDRIFKGDKPRDLPVEAPTKFELMINLKTAKALGLTVPAMLLSQADKLFE